MEKYYDNIVHEGSWKLLIASHKFAKPNNIPQLKLTVSSMRSEGSIYSKIVSLSADQLVLSISTGHETVYKSVSQTEGLIDKWNAQVAAQVAERNRIIEENKPREEIEKQTPEAIKGMPDAFEQEFLKPFTVVSVSGKIRSGPGTQYNQIGSMKRGGTVHVLAVTNVQWSDFLWYRIRYGKGHEGYVSGGLLCAKEEWIEGIHHYCKNF